MAYLLHSFLCDKVCPHCRFKGNFCLPPLLSVLNYFNGRISFEIDRNFELSRLFIWICDTEGWDRSKGLMELENGYTVVIVQWHDWVFHLDGHNWNLQSLSGSIFLLQAEGLFFKPSWVSTKINLKPSLLYKLFLTV